MAAVVGHPMVSAIFASVFWDRVRWFPQILAHGPVGHTQVHYQSASLPSQDVWSFTMLLYRSSDLLRRFFFPIYKTRLSLKLRQLSVRLWAIVLVAVDTTVELLKVDKYWRSVIIQVFFDMAAKCSKVCCQTCSLLAGEYWPLNSVWRMRTSMIFAYTNDQRRV